MVNLDQKGEEMKTFISEPQSAAAYEAWLCRQRDRFKVRKAVEPKRAAGKLAAALPEDPVSTNEIARQLGVSYRVAWHKLNYLVKTARAERVDCGGVTYWKKKGGE